MNVYKCIYIFFLKIQDTKACCTVVKYIAGLAIRQALQELNICKYLLFYSFCIFGHGVSQILFVKNVLQKLKSSTVNACAFVSHVIVNNYYYFCINNDQIL